MILLLKRIGLPDSAIKCDDFNVWVEEVKQRRTVNGSDNLSVKKHRMCKPEALIYIVISTKTGGNSTYSSRILESHANERLKRVMYPVNL